MTLRPPSRNFSSLVLPYSPVDAAGLLRISNFASGEPFFGKTRKNRFDDRRKLLAAKRFGTCYVGFTLDCAFAETVLHNRVAVDNGFLIPVEELERWVVSFEAAELRLAILTGAHLKALGGDGEISTISPYTLPGQWAVAVHEHPAKVDGLVYMSKHCNDQPAAVLFDRARRKLVLKESTPFARYAGSLDTMLRFGVSTKRGARP